MPATPAAVALLGAATELLKCEESAPGNSNGEPGSYGMRRVQQLPRRLARQDEKETN